MSNHQDLAPKLTKKQIHDELWRRGLLSWKCHKVQKDLYDKYYAAKEMSVSVWLISRRQGKSYLLALLSLEAALRNKNSIVKIVTDTKIHVKSIFEKLFLEIMEDMPDDIKPRYLPSEFTYYFDHNGSQIQMAGSDNKNYNRLRGQKASAVFVDEAGFCSDLDDVVQSVLLPTVMYTGGRIVLASTPAEDSDHPFLGFVERADLKGLLTKKTIDDNPLLTEAMKKAIEEEYGGRSNPRFRREMLCENIREASRTVIPEFTQELAARIVKEMPVPPHKDNYVSMDVGGKDLTGVLFGYYDFRADKIIIQDEIAQDFAEEGKTIKTLAEAIDKKEQELWTNVYTNEVMRPFKRSSDIDYILVKEIAEYNPQIQFSLTTRDNLAASINDLRTLLQSEKIIINPKCKNLIRHLENVKWKSENNKNEFARSPDNGHYDFVSSLIIMIRHIDFKRNPYPAGFGMNLNQDTYYTHGQKHFQQKHSGQAQQLDVYKKLFGIKKRS